MNHRPRHLGERAFQECPRFDAMVVAEVSGPIRARWRSPIRRRHSAWILAGLGVTLAVLLLTVG